MRFDDSGWERMGEPRPGEWLYYFKEEAQTYERYLAEVRNVKSERRRRIYICPLGSLPERYKGLILAVREYVGIFFNCEVVIGGSGRLPLRAYSMSRDQYNASTIIDDLVREVPEDALGFIGVTNRDLYAEGLNFVFGQASLTDRVGVYSLKRLQSHDERLFLRRVIGLVSHEIGHLLYIKHCVLYRCVMNGSNSLQEADRRPLHLCPIDLSKLQSNVGFDLVERYRGLEAFYDRHGLVRESGWVRGRISRLVQDGL
jgi:archaemetzincin